MKQKIAVVTGSSKGIGSAIARRLGKEKYLVYVTYYSDEKGGIETVEEIRKNGGSAALCHLDVTEELSVSNLFTLINQEHGHLDVLVNNAAKDVSKSIEESTLEEWKQAFDTKVHGAWLCTKYATPLLKKSGKANIIVVSSTADEKPNPEVLSYATSTAAVNALVKAWAVHLPPYGIRVNAVMPGPVRTDNWGDLKHDEELWKNFAAKNPMKRVATPKEVADAVMFLIEDPHKFLNGNFLFVDGGSNWV